MGIQSTIRPKIVHLPYGTCNTRLHIPQVITTKSPADFLLYKMFAWNVVHFCRGLLIQVSVHFSSSSPFFVYLRIFSLEQYVENSEFT